MRVFVLDNFDSFTYNLVQGLGALGAELAVERSDTSIDAVEASEPDAVVISPGPGRPEDAGISLCLVVWCLEHAMPLLGVCLGHQAIACAAGAAVRPAPRVAHGLTSPVYHDGRGIFRGLTSPIDAMRYHSLVVDEATLPFELEVVARTDDGLPMALRHRSLPICGVQFHPESILTRGGQRILKNFLEMAASRATGSNRRLYRRSVHG